MLLLFAPGEHLKKKESEKNQVSTNTSASHLQTIPTRPCTAPLAAVSSAPGFPPLNRGINESIDPNIFI